jgi:hypothetical protein
VGMTKILLLLLTEKDGKQTVSSTVSVANLHDSYVCPPTDTQKRINYID